MADRLAKIVVDQGGDAAQHTDAKQQRRRLPQGGAHRLGRRHAALQRPQRAIDRRTQKLRNHELKPRRRQGRGDGERDPDPVAHRQAQDAHQGRGIAAHPPIGRRVQPAIGARRAA